MRRCIKLDVRIDIESFGNTETESSKITSKTIIFQDYGSLTKLQVLELQNLISNYMLNNVDMT